MKTKHRIDLLKDERLRLEMRRVETVPLLGINIYSDEEIDVMGTRIAEIDRELRDIRADTGMS
jgi:hypothetical protein